MRVLSLAINLLTRNLANAIKIMQVFGTMQVLSLAINLLKHHMDIIIIVHKLEDLEIKTFFWNSESASSNGVEMRSEVDW